MVRRARLIGISTGTLLVSLSWGTAAFSAPPAKSTAGGAVPKSTAGGSTPKGTAGGSQPKSTTGGSPISGGTGKLKEQFVDIGPYMVGMQTRIREHWKPPKNLKTVMVRWQISSDGSITGLQISKSSGDPENDKAALDGVASSAPFAPLPPGMGELPIEFTFHNTIRSGVHSIPVSDQLASNGLSNAAIELVNKKELPPALDKLEFALDLDPKNPDVARVLRHVSAYVDEDTPDAVHILHRVLALDTRQEAAKEKLKILHRSAGHDPDSSEERLTMGNQYLDKKDAEGALAEFAAANAIKKDSCPSDNMVEAYRVLAAHRMAKKWEVILKTNRSIECLCGLGRAHQLAGEYDKADKCYKDALALDLGSEMAKALIAKLDEERKSGGATRDKIAAPTVADHSVGSSGSSDLIPRAQILTNEGVDLLKAEKVNDAIEKFREALKVDPTYKNARSNLSGSYNNQGIKLPSKDAVVLYRKALFVNPENDTARKNLNSHLQYEGKKPDVFDERIKLADEFASAGDYVSATVEAREALAQKKDAGAESKLKEFLKKAPAVP